MPKYMPQSLPAAGARPSMQQGANADGAGGTSESIHPAIQLGQSIRRERGIQGVQRYVVSMREHMGEDEYEELCSALGVPTDLQLPSQRRAPQQQQDPPQQQQQQSGAQMQQMQQFLPMLMSMMGGQGGMGAAPAAAAGGMNPMMLMQLMQMMQGMNGTQSAPPAQGGMNPMMLAQMLQAMQPK